MNMLDDDEKCPNCTWDGDMVAEPCEACERATDRLIDFLLHGFVAWEDES